jgi:hypothetical protein
MMVCEVATFSPLCATMTLNDCMKIDKILLTAYQYHLRCMPCDAKHSIFISEKRDGIEVSCFTREYVGALIRDVEVFISDKECTTTHAMLASIEATTKQCLWKLNQAGRIPSNCHTIAHARNIHISGKITFQYHDNAEAPNRSIISYDHTHTMEHAVRTTSLLGFMLCNLEHEFCSRFTDELLLKDKYAMTLGSPHISSRASLGACIGKGNLHFYKSSIFGHIYLLLQIIIEDVKQMIGSQNERHISDRLETILCWPAIYTH